MDEKIIAFVGGILMAAISIFMTSLRSTEFYCFLVVLLLFALIILLWGMLDDYFKKIKILNFLLLSGKWYDIYSEVWTTTKEISTELNISEKRVRELCGDFIGLDKNNDSWRVSDKYYNEHKDGGYGGIFGRYYK